MRQLWILFFLLGLIAGCSNEVDSEEIENEVSDLDQTITNSLLENFGYRNEVQEDAIQLVEFDESTGKLKLIAFVYSFEEESYEEFKADILDSCANVLQDVKRQQEVQEVELTVQTSVNLEAKELENAAIFKIIFKRSNLTNTNFHELDPLKLSQKATFYFEAPIQ